MSNAPRDAIRDRFTRISTRLTSSVGSPFALFAAVALILVWLLTGPIFNFSDTWQLFINTTTTIVTFLMVFVIQASQNRDSKALHLKLDEVIRAVAGARNEMIGAETETEGEIREQEAEFHRIAGHGGGAVTRTRHAATHPTSARSSHAGAPSGSAETGSTPAGSGQTRSTPAGSARSTLPESDSQAVRARRTARHD